jgi:hypothetical protein
MCVGGARRPASCWSDDIRSRNYGEKCLLKVGGLAYGKRKVKMVVVGAEQRDVA